MNISGYNFAPIVNLRFAFSVRMANVLPKISVNLSEKLLGYLVRHICPRIGIVEHKYYCTKEIFQTGCNDI